MCYKNAELILPKELIKVIQKYIDGENIYIPRKENIRKKWGSNTTIREELKDRNQKIFDDYKKGLKYKELASKYFLSIKSIQRIIREIKTVEHVI